MSGIIENFLMSVINVWLCNYEALPLLVEEDSAKAKCKCSNIVEIEAGQKLEAASQIVVCYRPNHNNPSEKPCDQEAPKGATASHPSLFIIITVLSIALSTLENAHKENSEVVGKKY
jgi:hypothetical protein